MPRAAAAAAEEAGRGDKRKARRPVGALSKGAAVGAQVGGGGGVAGEEGAEGGGLGGGEEADARGGPDARDELHAERGRGGGPEGTEGGGAEGAEEEEGGGVAGEHDGYEEFFGEAAELFGGGGGLVFGGVGGGCRGCRCRSAGDGPGADVLGGVLAEVALFRLGSGALHLTKTK